MSHRITFATTEDRDKFLCSLFAAVPHCWLDDSPTSAQYVPQFGPADDAHLSAVSEFLKECFPGAALIVDLSAPGGVGTAPTAGSFVQTLIDNIGPLLESLPTVLHGIESAKAKVALRLHIQKIVAERAVSNLDMTCGAHIWTAVGAAAGEAATKFADAMQAELDAADAPEPEANPDA